MHLFSCTGEVMQDFYLFGLPPPRLYSNIIINAVLLLLLLALYGKTYSLDKLRKGGRLKRNIFCFVKLSS